MFTKIYIGLSLLVSVAMVIGGIYVTYFRKTDESSTKRSSNKEYIQYIPLTDSMLMSNDSIRNYVDTVKVFKMTNLPFRYWETIYLDTTDRKLSGIRRFISNGQKISKEDFNYLRNKALDFKRQSDFDTASDEGIRILLQFEASLHDFEDSLTTVLVNDDYEPQN